VRIPTFDNIGAVPTTVEKNLQWVAALLRSLFKSLREIEKAINGNLTFGDGTSADNISGKWVTYTTHATPDAESTITHSLGVVPPGFIIMKPPSAGYVYRGGTTWTTTNLYLKATAADESVTIFVLSKPQPN